MTPEIILELKIIGFAIISAYLICSAVQGELLFFNKMKNNKITKTPTHEMSNQYEQSRTELRDKFAGDALMGIFTRPHCTTPEHMKRISNKCYLIADAMIAERENHDR